jgi:hypothetical protein
MYSSDQNTEGCLALLAPVIVIVGTMFNVHYTWKWFIETNTDVQLSNWQAIVGGFVVFIVLFCFLKLINSFKKLRAGHFYFSILIGWFAVAFCWHTLSGPISDVYGVWFVG